MKIAADVSSGSESGQAERETYPCGNVPPETPTIAARLRAARVERLLDQGELGTRANMPATSISLFESGKRTPNVESLIRLANVLEVSLDYLAGRSDDPTAHLSSGGVRQHQQEVKRQLEEIELRIRETRAWFGTRKQASAP